MNPSSRRTALPLALALAAALSADPSPGAPPAQAAPLTAVLSRIEGNVTVQERAPQRSGSPPSIRRAQLLQVVGEEDEIHVPAGAGAVLVCSTDRAVTLKGGAKRLTEGLCQGGTPLPAGTYQGLAPRGGRLRSIAGVLVLERLARSPDDELLMFTPLLLRPRNTVVLEPRPEIVWTLHAKLATVVDYEIQVRGDVHFAFRLPAGQVRCTPVAGTERAECSAPYPASEPELPPGASALLQISSWETGATQRGEKVPLWVRRLPAERAAEISAQAKALAGLPVGENARRLLQADLYAGHRIYADAIDLYREVLGFQDVPEVRVTLGDLYLAVGLLSEAGRVYQEASSAGPAVQAAATFGLGRIEQAHGRFREARQRFEEARKLYSGLGLEEEAAAAEKAADEARAEGRRAFDAFLQTDPKLIDSNMADALIAEWREARLRAADTRERARLLRELGALFAVRAQAARSGPRGGTDEDERSEVLLRRAVRLLGDAGDPGDTDLADARLHLAQSLSSAWCPEPSYCADRRAEALALAEEVLRAARGTGRAARIAAALRVVASIQADRREVERAIELLEEALRLDPAGAEWSLGRVEALAELASLYRWQEQPGRAWRLYREAATGCIELGLPGSHRVVGWVAFGYYLLIGTRDSPPAAVGQEGQELLELARSESNDDMRLLLLIRSWATGGGGESVVELAELLLRRGQLDMAERVISDSLQQDFGISSEYEWALRVLEAEVLFRLGDTDAARVALKALREGVITEPTIGFKVPYWLQRSARVLVELDTARCDHVALRGSLQDLLAAEQVLTGNMSRQESEAGFRSIAFDLAPEDELFAPAVRCGLRDPDILRTTVERILLRREIWRYRTQIVGNARGSGDPGRAAEAELLGAWRRRRAQLRLRVDDEALAAELETVQIPDNLSHPEWASAGINAVAQVEYVIDIAESRLTDAMPFEKERAGLWPGLIRALGAGSVLLGYLPVVIPSGGRRLVAFVVDGQGGTSWADLGDEAAISRRLDGNWARLVARTDDGKDALRRAGEDLFDPIEASLGGRRRILLLASGPIRFLPWNAMVDSRGRFLGDRFASVWFQSAADAVPGGASGNPAPGEVVLLAPEYEAVDAAKLVPRLSSRIVPPDFPPLPGARDELAELEEMFQAQGIRHEVVRGAKTTEASLRSLRSPTVLHIAAHGFRIPPGTSLLGGDAQLMDNVSLYWPSRPKGFLEPSFLRVGVALSGANRGGVLWEDDGLLTASEAADLDLRGTSLVVLSGCETAYPTLQDAGGAYDLSLGFRMAGARSVVGSLWRVDDRAASLLMTEMYRLLAAGETVADALWHAMQTLRSDPVFSHPYFWAPFQVLGTGEAVWPLRRPVAVQR